MADSTNEEYELIVTTSLFAENHKLLATSEGD